MGTRQDSLTESLIKAFRAGELLAPDMQGVMERLRALTEEEQEKIGMPNGATDLELFEYVMRAGGQLLLSVDTKKH